MGENIENNWLVNNVLLLPANFICEEVDRLLDFLEVSEFLIWNFVEFGPRLDVFRCMVESQLKRSPSNNTLKIKT